MKTTDDGGPSTRQDDSSDFGIEISNFGVDNKNDADDVDDVDVEPGRYGSPEFSQTDEEEQEKEEEELRDEQFGEEEDEIELSLMHGYSSRSSSIKVDLDPVSEDSLISELARLQDSFRWNADVENNLAKLKDARKELTDAAQAARKLRPEMWTIEVRHQFRAALIALDFQIHAAHAFKSKSTRKSGAIQELPADVRRRFLLTKLLSDRKVLRKLGSVFMGWSIIGFIFYFPWIIASFFLLDDVLDSPDMSLVCSAAGQTQFIIGFITLMLVNFCFFVCDSVMKIVKEGNKWWSRHGKKVVLLPGLAMIGLNLYGLRIVWEPVLPGTTSRPQDCKFFVFIILVLSFFLALPILVFATESGLKRIKPSLTGVTRLANTDSSDNRLSYPLG